MDFEAREREGVLIVKPLAKRIDSGNAPAFKSGMVDYIIKDEIKVAIDLSDVEFMDSSGLSSLLSTYKTISKKGKMVIFGVRQNVGQLFAITRLDKGIFTIARDEEHALTMFVYDGLRA
ncbi:anti-sigma factor antagonist [Desulfonatronovibrio magnus]|uniref:anti-sigma factor antagonist n=1 Tax=Desulfonatronovibrio magnus TaxID=698827 RepID=UPI0005EB1A5B|nr:anti-sigma factor antagonist [Desulfonatronovibrio magnus]RQD60709.1 MAG: STAS domain-containing protein [Desulfonatronovibrio sp. MSAO_Bac4]